MRDLLMHRRPPGWYSSGMELLTSIVRDEDAASLIEYAVLLMLVALVALSAIELLGNQLNNVFKSISDVFLARHVEH